MFVNRYMLLSIIMLCVLDTTTSTETSINPHDKIFTDGWHNQINGHDLYLAISQPLGDGHDELNNIPVIIMRHKGTLEDGFYIQIETGRKISDYKPLPGSYHLFKKTREILNNVTDNNIMLCNGCVLVIGIDCCSSCNAVRRMIEQ